ncbi:hypothetical protein ACLQ3C_14490 [Gordonia sp. DT30]|uniref:TPR repeat region-containing protein n=1 Tax=Gordonia sp. DT30 TaxID=3416546 RepID=UPI003CFAEAA2
MVDTANAGIPPLQSSVDRQATSMHSTICGLDWQGQSASAAFTRADRELTEQRRFENDGLRSLLNAAGQMGEALAEQIDTLKTQGHALEGDDFRVDEDWSVHETLNFADAERTASEADDTALLHALTAMASQRAQRAANATAYLQSLATTLFTTDNDTANAIKSAMEAITTLAPASAGLNAEMADRDLSNGHLGPQAISDLQAALHLTPQQLEAIKNGQDVDIPQGQYDYLQRLMRKMDGRSLTDLNSEIDKQLGPRGGQYKSLLGDAFEVMSGSHTHTVAGGRGGMQQLPTELRGMLTDGYPFENQQGSYGVLQVKHLGDWQVLNSFLQNGNPALRAGTDLDRGLLRQASIIGGTITHGGGKEQWNTDVPDYDEVQGVLSNMLHNAAPDHEAVADFLTGRDMAGVDPNYKEHTGQQAFLSLVTHHWDNHAGGLDDVLNGIGQGAHAGGFQGTLGAESADVVAHVLGDPANSARLLGSTPMGEYNPEVAQTLTKNLIPYLGNLGGVETPGIDAHALHAFNTTDEFTNMIKVLDTDPVSARAINIAGAAWTNHLAYEYGLHGDESYARAAGVFNHVFDDANTQEAAAIVHGNEVMAAMKEEDRQREWDTVQAILGTGFAGVPSYHGVGLLQAMNILAPAGKAELLDPSSVSNYDDQWSRGIKDANWQYDSLAGPDARAAAIVQGYADTHPEFVQQNSPYFNGGRLDIDAVNSDSGTFRDLYKVVRQQYDNGFNDSNEGFPAGRDSTNHRIIPFIDGDTPDPRRPPH